MGAGLQFCSHHWDHIQALCMLSQFLWLHVIIDPTVFAWCLVYFLGVLHPFWLAHALHFLFCMVTWNVWWGYDYWRHPYNVSIWIMFQVSHALHIVQLWIFCIYFHVLEEKASLMMTEQVTWLWQNVLRSHFVGMFFINVLLCCFLLCSRLV